MSLASIAFNQILIMFLIIFTGFICYKLGMIDKETNKKLSNLLLLLVNPLVIVVSYQRDLTSELLNGLLVSFLLAIATHIIGIIISSILVRGKENKDLAIERFSTVYTNCGFMGIPLINGIIGSEGVFYITAYMTIFNLFIWTHGLFSMIGKQDKKTTLKTLISPTLISIILGFIMFIAGIKLPSSINATFTYIADMNTPLAMLIAGVTIAQTDIKKLFIKFRIYWVALVRLIIIPLVLLLLYSRFPIATPVIVTALVAAACPTAATGTLFAIRYNKNALYASEIFAITTLLSLLSIPIIIALMELMI